MRDRERHMRKRRKREEEEGRQCSSAAAARVAGDPRARWDMEELLSSGSNMGEKAAGRWLLEVDGWIKGKAREGGVVD